MFTILRRQRRKFKIKIYNKLILRNCYEPSVEFICLHFNNIKFFVRGFVIKYRENFLRHKFIMKRRRNARENRKELLEGRKRGEYKSFDDILIELMERFKLKTKSLSR